MIACVVWPAGCSSPGASSPIPVSAAASGAMLDAWEAARVPGFDAAAPLLQLEDRLGEHPIGVDQALERAEAARSADGTWAVPERFIDDWRHRPWLTLPERYGEHLEAARRGSAVGAYLAARLGGSAADRRMDQALRLDPLLAWAWHGEAWRSFGRGQIRQAIAAGSRALRFARDPGERAHFTWALGRYLRADERDARARDVLEGALKPSSDGTSRALTLRPSERTMVELELALAEMSSVQDSAVRRGVHRGLGVLRRTGIPTQDRVSLALALASADDRLVVPDEITLALLGAERAAQDGAEAEALRDLRGRGLEQDASEGTLRGTRREQLVMAFEQGPGEALRDGVMQWTLGLPEWLKDPDGFPTRPILRQVVSMVLQLEPTSPSGEATPDRAELGKALLQAGWFREARAWSRWIADPSSSAEIEEGAVRGRAILGSLRALGSRLDAREAFLASGAVADDGVTSLEEGRIGSIGALREEIVRRFQSAGDSADIGKEQPSIAYGPLGSILHPGPEFSLEDEASGRGTAGDSVPGIAQLFGAMGRFALIGNGVGQGGPDATILRVVGVETREGTHLGRAFRGTVFWCEGADVPGRFGRLGAAISGAALHEGYYVDLEMVGVEKAQWDAVRARFQGKPGRLRAALDVLGAEVPKGQRTETTPPLGAADRMRLAVMVNPSDGVLREVSLGELAHVVATHEEGHLCDRAQWYPLSFGRLLKLLSFATAHGFRSGSIARALEERAQLVALCESNDVRLAWIDILDAAESSGGGLTPHGGAYRRVLQDLVNRLEREWRRGEWPEDELDPKRRWVDQLHRVDPERLRGLAVREAASRGLSK